MKKQQFSKIGRDFLSDESGATAIEYGLIASGVVMLIIGSLKSLQNNVAITFDTVGGELEANNNP